MGVKRKRKNRKRVMGAAPRGKVLQIRLSTAEHKGLTREAKRQGVSMAELLMRPWRGKGD